jgi:hypothetical protein
VFFFFLSGFDVCMIFFDKNGKMNAFKISHKEDKKINRKEMIYFILFEGYKKDGYPRKSKRHLNLQPSRIPQSSGLLRQKVFFGQR